jgi:hypothetical protein
MKNACKCRVCGREFQPDGRNQGRQGYCSRPGCQRQRRTLAQRLRRRKSAAVRMRSESPDEARRLQAASVISEADIRSENPAIIGLISMVTGLTNLEDIERVYRQLWLRGKQILSVGQAREPSNGAIISLLEHVERRKHPPG